MTTTPFIAGAITQASLITVIGAQNNFVLRQGLQQQHVKAVVIFCIVSDIILTAIGVMGLGSVLTLYPTTIKGMEYIAGGFLLLYAGFSFYRAYKSTPDLSIKGHNNVTLKTVLLMIAGFTWLNPHVWLDTVLLLGTVGQAQPAGSQWAFLIGASMASIVWFTTIGYGARILRPLFITPIAWRLLDIATGLMMCCLAGIVLSYESL
jgi:L-lysine exporter family protein LysE/ArgO